MKKINFFTLDDPIKSGILLLDVKFFLLEKLSVSKDERDHDYEIEEYLENIEDRDEYLKKEILLEENETEDLVLLLLIKEQIIIDIMKKLKKHEILAIYPKFFIGYFDKLDKNRKIIEKDSENTYEFIFENNKLIDFNKKDENDGKISKIDYSKISGKVIEDYSFLPIFYLEERKLKKHVKIVLLLLICIIFITSIFVTITNISTEDKISEIQDRSDNIIKLNDEIKEKKEKIRFLIDETTFDKEEKKNFSNIIKEILKSKVKINVIRYNGKLEILGVAKDTKEILAFENYILSLKDVKKLNHEYIIKENNGYKFHLIIFLKGDKDEED